MDRRVERRLTTILAAFVVPKLLSRPDEARITKAATDIKGIEQALGLFKLDSGFYPTTEQGLAALVSRPRNMSDPLSDTRRC